MKLVVVGRAHEIEGFALAGVETALCVSARDAEGLVSGLASHDAGAGLIFVSPWVDHHARHAIAQARQRKGPPVIVTLPDSALRGN